MSQRQPWEVFVDRLRELIPERRAATIGARANVSAAMLSRWKNGALVPNPQLQTLARLAAVLRVPIAYLISDGVYEPPFDPGEVEKLLRASEDSEATMKRLRDAVRRVTQTKKP